MKNTRLCKLCQRNPAAVPDRDRYMGVWRREVCLECHAERLRADFAHILKRHIKGQP